MSVEHETPAASSAEPGPPRLSRAMQLLLASGILGGALGLLAFVSVLVLLWNHIDRNLPAETVATGGPPSGAGRSERVPPIVVMPSEDRATPPPSDETARLDSGDLDEAVRDRTKVHLAVRFVQLDLHALGDLRRRGEATWKPAETRLVEALCAADGHTAPCPLDEPKPSSLDAWLDDMEQRGVVREMGAARITTEHSLPARAELAAPPRRTARDRRGTRFPALPVTFSCLPRLLDEERLVVDVSVDSAATSPANAYGGREAGGSVNARVELAHGQTVVLAGPTQAVPAGSAMRQALLVSAELEQPAEPERVQPLSETERLDRRAEQCRYLQKCLAKEFPASQIKLSLAAGKLFVHGSAPNDKEMSRILAVVRRRAVDEWSLVEPAPRLSYGSPLRQAPESLVVNMLRTPPRQQVLVRLRVLELGPQAVDSLGRLATAGQASMLDTALEAVKPLLRLEGPGQSLVLDETPDEAIGRLARRGLVRVLNEPTLVTTSGRKGTLLLGNQIEWPLGVENAPSRHKLAGLFAEQPGGGDAYRVGTTFTVLPEVLQGDRIRLEVTPDVRRLVDDGRRSDPPRLVLQSQSITAAAVLEPGQTLVVSGVPVDPTAEGSRPAAHAQSVARRLLFVTPELVGVPEASHTASTPAAAVAVPEPRVGDESTLDVPDRQTAVIDIPSRASAQEGTLAAFFRKHGGPLRRGELRSAEAPREEEKTERLPPVDEELTALSKVVRAGELFVPVDGFRVVATTKDVLRATAVDPLICQVTRSGDREVTLAGKAAGATHVSVWFRDSNTPPVSFKLHAVGDVAAEQQKRKRIETLEEVVEEIFPRSRIRLHFDGDRLVVEGDTSTRVEASQVLAVVRGEARAAAADGPLEVVDRLRVLGRDEVALRVQFLAVEPAVLRRAAADVERERPRLAPLAARLLHLAEKGGQAFMPADLAGDVTDGIRQMERLGLVRILAQPSLVAKDDRPAEYTLALDPRPIGNVPFGARIPRPQPSTAVFRFLPEVLSHNAIRLRVEAEPASETGSASPRHTSPTEAEVPVGQALALADLDSDAEDDTRLIVLVMPELIDVAPVAVGSGDEAPAGPSDAQGPGYTVAESPTQYPRADAGSSLGLPETQRPDEPRNVLRLPPTQPIRVRREEAPSGADSSSSSGGTIVR